MTQVKKKEFREGKCTVFGNRPDAAHPARNPDLKGPIAGFRIQIDLAGVTRDLARRHQTFFRGNKVDDFAKSH